MVRLGVLSAFVVLSAAVLLLTPGTEGRFFGLIRLFRFPRIPVPRIRVPRPNRTPVYRQPRPPTRPPQVFRQPRPTPNPSKPNPPKPNTPKPNTPKPNTPKPNTPKPNTSKPNTPKPNTPKPNTPKPNTPKPNTSKPNTPKPNTPKPNTPKPNTPKPNMPKPVTPKPNTPEQKKQSFFQTLKTGCKQNKFQCGLTGLDLALTVTDFVRFGVEIKLYNDRIEAQRLEFESQRNQSIEDQQVFIDTIREFEERLNNTDGFNSDSVCSNDSIAAINDGSSFFECPLAENADNENRCCGQPGEQVCCADPSVDPPFFEEIGGEEVCSNATIAEINDGSPYFVCPLLENADNEIACCGDPGVQNCCAP